MNEIKLKNSYFKSNVVEYIAIAIAAFTLFTIIWPVILSIHDDIISYIVTRKGEILKSAVTMAKSQGRIGFFIGVPMAHLPFIFNNFIVYRLISYASICFSVIALGILIKNNINNTVALLSMLFFFTFAQLDGQHNLLVSYVFTHQIAIGFMLLSIERLTSFYKNKNKNKKNLIISALLLLFATILYESFILFSIFLFFISLLDYKKIKFSVAKKIIIDLRYHIILMSLYLVLFFIWRFLYPSNYDGAQFELGNIIDSLKVMFTYGLARFPLVSTIFKYHQYKYSMIEPTFIIKALFASMASIVIFKKADKINLKISMYSLILCILGIFLPILLLSVTPKYIGWVRAGSYAYVPSFYSYFFIIAFISILATSIYQKLNGFKIQGIYILFVIVIVFCSSVLTDINNKLEADNYEKYFEKYKAFDNAVSSKYFKDIENGATIYIPEYNGIHNHMPYMDYYASIYSEKRHIFTNKIEDLTFENPTYGFHYDATSGNMLIGKMKSNMMVDTIYIINNKPINNQTAIIYQDNKNAISVNGSTPSIHEKVAIIPLNLNENCGELRGNNLDLFGSGIFNERLQNESANLVSIGDGFYSKEIWGNDIAYWCNSKGKFKLYNTFAKERYAIVSARIACGDDKQPYNLYLTGKDVDDKYTITASQQELSFRLLLQPGQNDFTFRCDSPPLEDGSRKLVFYVLNFDMKFEED